jgi:outer membrane protein assembly factor BamE
MISPYSSRRFANLLGAGFAWLAVAAALLTLSACETTNNLSNRVAGIVSPYKIDVVQGNFVSKEQAAALRPGMSRPQVRDVLGTPLLMSMFHGDRWDYVFTFQRQGVEPQSRRVTVYFKGDVLERFEAGELPTEAEFVASLDSGRSSGKVPVLEASEESLAKFGAANKAPDGVAGAAQPTPAPAPLPERYPPLESSGR